MKLKAVLAMGILMAVCVLTMPTDESDAADVTPYLTLIDELNGTTEYFECRAPFGAISPVSEDGTSLEDALSPTCNGHSLIGWQCSRDGSWIYPGEVPQYRPDGGVYYAQWEDAPYTNTNTTYVIAGLFIVMMIAFVGCLYGVFLYNPKN